MNITPFKSPWLTTKFFSDYTWKKPTDNKTIYLTFDDGPTPEVTNWVLEILKQYNAKATFFCIGNNIGKYPELFRKIIDENHKVANHTYYHEKGWKTKNQDYLNSITHTERLLCKMDSNNKSMLFRPPYGQIRKSQGKALIEMGYEIVMWSVLTQDWNSNISNEFCYKKTIKSINKGSIVVFHDSLKAEEKLKYLLPRVLKHFSDKGFNFKSL